MSQKQEGEKTKADKTKAVKASTEEIKKKAPRNKNSTPLASKKKSSAPVVEVIAAPKEEDLAVKRKRPQSNGKNLPANIQIKLANAIEKQNQGRASEFTDSKALVLLGALADGSTIQTACKKIGVSRTTFYTWKSVVPGFLDMVTQAQELQADSMVDDSVQALQSVDVESKDADPRRLMAQLRKAEQVARFKFDLAKCLNFKTYGDKKAQLNMNLNAEVTNADISKWFNQ